MRNERKKTATDATEQGNDAQARPLGPDSAKKGGRPEDVGPDKGAGSQTPLK